MQVLSDRVVGRRVQQYQACSWTNISRAFRPLLRLLEIAGQRKTGNGNPRTKRKKSKMGASTITWVSRREESRAPKAIGQQTRRYTSRAGQAARAIHEKKKTCASNTLEQIPSIFSWKTRVQFSTVKAVSSWAAAADQGITCSADPSPQCEGASKRAR